MEVLPKEKKQKDEKTVMLGQCAIDLYPLLQGKPDSNQFDVFTAVSFSCMV